MTAPTDKLDGIEARWTLGLIGEGDIWCSQDYADAKWVITEIKRLRDLLAEVKSCGHWSDCPAGVNHRYRCRCAYGIILEAGV